ncbi:MAG TPA: hypothetical protein VFU82_02135 [Gammaproteobacteria bacterium]|nr:hypothetical protein [Gammaproteobacteria bacterium]
MSITQEISNARIRLHLDVHTPIELIEMTLSFQAIAYEYRDYLKKAFVQQGKSTSEIDSIKLYITKIENNCILAELASASMIMGQLFSGMGNINTFVDFVQNIKNSIDYFRTLAKQKNVAPKDLEHTKQQCARYADLLKIAAENKDGQLGISVIEYQDETQEAKIKLTIKFDSNEAFEARKGALLAKEAFDYKEDATYKNVLMYFQQTNIDEAKNSGRTGDKAIIKAIHPKELPVYFISEIDQQKINYEKHDPDKNPLKCSYIVDVNVETDRFNMPKFYRIMRINEVIPPDDSAEIQPSRN